MHLICGLPRAGSTLLSAILRQNPAFDSSISSALCDLFSLLLQGMSFSEGAIFISAIQRRRILRGLVEAFYCEGPRHEVIFDTNRGWPAMAGAVAELLPDARFICCVRSPAWVLDSFESLMQRNPLLISRIFESKRPQNIYVRVEQLMAKSGIVGGPLAGLRQAWYGPHSHRLIAVRYESLVAQPATILSRLYKAIGEQQFEHDFDHVEYDQPEFDARLNMPGLHRVTSRVEPRKRTPCLPPDLFKQYDRAFWDLPGQNTTGVTIL
jgi:sulfotransferase